jgi:hypothetical protein
MCADLPDLLTAVGTIAAVVVALGIAIVPAMWRRHKTRLISEKHSYLCINIVNQAIEKYRYHNITRYDITGDGKFHFAYSLKELPISVDVDLGREIDNLVSAIDSLSRKNQVQVWKILRLLKLIISGFPVEEEQWNKLQGLLEEAFKAFQEKRHIARQGPA